MGGPGPAVLAPEDTAGFPLAFQKWHLCSWYQQLWVPGLNPNSTQRAWLGVPRGFPAASSAVPGGHSLLGTSGGEQVSCVWSPATHTGAAPRLVTQHHCPLHAMAGLATVRDTGSETARCSGPWDTSSAIPVRVVQGRSPCCVLVEELGVGLDHLPGHLAAQRSWLLLAGISPVLCNERGFRNGKIIRLK